MYGSLPYETAALLASQIRPNMLHFKIFLQYFSRQCDVQSWPTAPITLIAIALGPEQSHNNNFR